MIERLLQFSVRKRGLVIILTLVFVLIGVIAGLRVPIDAVPDVTNVQVQIISAAPALGPVDVEKQVTAPIERAMAGLPRVGEIRSISRPGISVVTVAFEDGTELAEARHLVDQRLGDAKQEIPSEIAVPQLGPMSSGLGEIVHFEVKGSGQSLMELRSVLDWIIAPRLKLVPGVTEVNTFGGESKTLEIQLDAQRMREARVGVTEVITAVEKNHLMVGGAYLIDGRETMSVRADARIQSLDDLGEIVIERRGDRTPLLVKDIASVQYAPRVRFGAVTRDGRGEAVVGVVMMLVGANSRETVKAVKETLDDLAKSLPDGVTIDTYYERSLLVQRTIKTVTTNLLEATALVILVLLVTLLSLRAGTIVALAIPLALLAVFVGMWAAGVSGNLLSLGALDFGLVVDGAIIIIENAQRHLAEKRIKLGRKLTDEERQETVLDAAREVRGATAFGEAIIALVYVPLFALEGVEGRMFRPMAMTVLFALAGAFVLSLTVVPALASMFLSRNTKDRESPLISLVQWFYRPMLRGSMRLPIVSLLVALGVFASSLLVASKLGKEFLPKLDEGTIVIPAVRLPSVSLEQSLDHTTMVEQELKKNFPEVITVVSRTGRAEIAIDPMGMNMTDIYVILKPREEWVTAKTREALVTAIDKHLSDRIPGIGFSFSQPIEMNTNDLLAGISSDVAVHIYGHDLIQLKRLADQVSKVLRDINGAKDVRAEQTAGSTALNIRILRQAAARYGLDAKTVFDTVRALGGIELGTVLEDGAKYPIQARLNSEARKDQESVAALPVRAPDGVMVPLGQLTSIQLEPAPAQVSRERLARRVTVQCNVRGRDLASFVAEARKTLDKQIKLPAGYSYAWAGDFERLERAQKRLLIVVPVALALILVLLVSTFGRMKPALLIFLNVPMALSGGIFALWLRQIPLSISAAVGFIALFGVAVLNGLVLVSSIERIHAEGKTLREAVREGAEHRLRPVLTTALVASLGFLPMALATGAGAEVQRPLATVVIGGLITSTFLTMLVLPSVYALSRSKDERKGNNKEKDNDEGSTNVEATRNPTDAAKGNADEPVVS